MLLARIIWEDGKDMEGLILKHFSGIPLESLKKIMKTFRTSGKPAEIQIGYVPDSSPELYRCVDLRSNVQLLRCFITTGSRQVMEEGYNRPA
jgi:hypothetical protein